MNELVHFMACKFLTIWIFLHFAIKNVIFPFLIIGFQLLVPTSCHWHANCLDIHLVCHCTYTYLKKIRNFHVFVWKAFFVFWKYFIYFSTIYNGINIQWKISIFTILEKLDIFPSLPRKIQRKFFSILFWKKILKRLEHWNRVIEYRCQRHFSCHISRKK